MRRPLLGILVFAALLLQVTLFGKIEIFGARPDGVLIVLVYIALAFGAIVGSIVGFLVGLAQFAIMATALASLPLAGTVVGFAVGRYGTKIMYESYLVQLVIIFASVVIFDSINMLWSAPAGFGWSLARWTLPAAAYTALVGVGLVVVLERVFGMRLVL
jgi:rod shape-determining protein MreD